MDKSITSITQAAKSKKYNNCTIYCTHDIAFDI